MSKKNKQFKCTHKGFVPFLQLGKCTLHAGASYDVVDAIEQLHPKVIISVGGDYALSAATSPVVKFQNGAEVLAPAIAGFYKHVEIPPAIVVDWSDGWTPPTSVKWWNALIEDIAKIDGNVLIFCVGGHGRTGTALAILAHMTGAAQGPQDLVAWVRERYCQEAVESNEQMDWMERMFHIKITSIPSKPPAGTAYYYQNFAPVPSPVADPSVVNDGSGGPCFICNAPNSPYNPVAETYLCTADQQRYSAGGT